jgi:hypothetical protein
MDDNLKPSFSSAHPHFSEALAYASRLHSAQTRLFTKGPFR